MSTVKLAATRYALSAIMSDAAADKFAQFDLFLTDLSYTAGNSAASFAKLKARNPNIIILVYANFSEFAPVNRPPAWWQKIMAEKWMMRQAPFEFTAAPAAGTTSATLVRSWPGPTGTYNLLLVETVGGAIVQRAATLTKDATTATWTGGLANACNAVAAAHNAPFLAGYAGSVSFDITRNDGNGDNFPEWVADATADLLPPNCDGVFVDVYQTGLAALTKIFGAPVLAGATRDAGVAGDAVVKAAASTLGTLNQYAGHYLMITSGTDAGRVIYVAGNDASGAANNLILLAGCTLPAAIPSGSTYELYPPTQYTITNVTSQLSASLSSDGLTPDATAYDGDSSRGHAIMNAARRRGLDRLRERLPGKLIMLNTGSSAARMSSHHDLTAADNVCVEYEGAFGKSYSRGWQHSLSAYRNMLRRFPQSLANCGSVATSYRTAAPDPELSQLRFSFLSGCLAGGYLLVNDIAGAYTSDDPVYLDEMAIFGRGVSPAYVDQPPSSAHWANGVWKREFATCLVVVNPTAASQTIDLTGQGWNRLLGTQDPALNDGTAAGSITLAAGRAQLFVR